MACVYEESLTIRSLSLILDLIRRKMSHLPTSRFLFGFSPWCLQRVLWAQQPCEVGVIQGSLEYWGIQPGILPSGSLTFYICSLWSYSAIFIFKLNKNSATQHIGEYFRFRVIINEVMVTSETRSLILTFLRNFRNLKLEWLLFFRKRLSNSLFFFNCLVGQVI